MNFSLIIKSISGLNLKLKKIMNGTLILNLKKTKNKKSSGIIGKKRSG